MADRKKQLEGNKMCAKSVENASAMSSISEIFTYRDCISTILNLLSHFGSELKLNEAVLKINVSVNALDVPSSQPAHVYNCLQRHISKLQAVSESLKPQVVDADWPSPATAARGLDMSAARAPVGDEVSGSEHIPPRGPGDMTEGDEEGKSQDDDLTVQIKASKSEIDRRISAFMERKQLEINENNVREFCNVIDCNQENSCARTEAVFTPYPGFKSHVKVTRVVNTYGPQTRGGQSQEGPVGSMGPEMGPPIRTCGNSAIEERLHNIETHLKLPTEGPVPLSVYQRLKKLEDRILELEGLSPEYFQSNSYLHKRPKRGSAQACSLSELEGKISAVKAALLKRVTEFGPGYGAECSL
ncbi:MAP3K12-binding inhibitory protein 1 [Hypomesus transpacificus]|uniref:MAP3K12-binding inhibitory protein 1 n=1 Tax=Hypomesus transpacificus TaxID=137520 RepID=UPI001F07B619|nr:MAP3K12-binding inhibitory protein 1 [Hypomesus transpacificus]